MNSIADISIELYRWTVEDYHRLAEAGILDENSRVELLNGQIVQMSPVGDFHAACVELLDEFFRDIFGKSVNVRVQNPVSIELFSEPEPDLAVLKRKNNFYADGHPGPEDILLLVEVADSTLAIDRQIKKKLYATAGIKEYWIVNIPEKQVEQFLNPSAEDYQQIHIYKMDEELKSDLTGPIRVRNLFPAFDH